MVITALLRQICTIFRKAETLKLLIFPSSKPRIKKAPPGWEGALVYTGMLLDISFFHGKFNQPF